MKVGIVGSGLVGSTAGYAIVMRGVARELVLVDLNRARASAEADDILHAVPFARPVNVRSGEYVDLEGSQVVVITAGVNQKPGESRLELLGRNAGVFHQVIPSVLAAAPDAILLVATNPVDIMTHLAARYAAEFNVPSQRVVGSGTTLDTARFRSLLSQTLGVDSMHIHAYVLGEHGDSEVLPWSIVTVGGMPLDQFCAEHRTEFCDDDRTRIDEQVRRAAYNIIAGKGATYYGIGGAIARIVEVILRDQRSILTVCSPAEEISGVRDVTISIPRLVGGQGVLAELKPPLTEEEEANLHNSAGLIRSYLDEIETG